MSPTKVALSNEAIRTKQIDLDNPILGPVRHRIDSYAGSASDKGILSVLTFIRVH